MSETDAQNEWTRLVYDKAKEVDPNDDHDWFDLAYGFFMGLGFDPSKAFQLALDAEL